MMHCVMMLPWLRCCDIHDVVMAMASLWLQHHHPYDHTMPTMSPWLQRHYGYDATRRYEIFNSIIILWDYCEYGVPR